MKIDRRSPQSEGFKEDVILAYISSACYAFAEKLVEQFGVDGTRDRIRKLNLYVGSVGKKYKSHHPQRRAQRA